MLNCYKTRGGTTYIRGKIEGDDQSLLVITISGDRLRGVLLVPSLGNCAIRSDAEGIHIQLLQGESWSCGTGG